jgi:hypothetical protein
MLRTWQKAILLLAAALAAAGAHAARVPLDARRAEAPFRELLYVPSGKALRVIAFGFDSPLADALWVRGLIYFSDNLRAILHRGDRTARYRYVYRLHDVITDLNPRFAKAYLYGGLFLLSTGREAQIRQGIDILEKGVRAYERARDSGQPLPPEAGWQLHLQLAQAYDNFGWPGIYDRRAAAKHFRAAAEQPGTPTEIVRLLEAHLQQGLQRASLRERTGLSLRVWESVLGRRIEREVAALREQLARLERTEALEAELTRIVRTFRQRFGRLPESVPALVSGGILPERPASPFDADRLEETGRPDRWLILPDGSVRSRWLARLEAGMRRQFLFEAVRAFTLRHDGRVPASLDRLVEEGLLEFVPEHPLRAAGWRFTYDPRDGSLGVRAPDGSD